MGGYKYLASPHFTPHLTLKGNAISDGSMYWSKVLSKPFILMQSFSKSAQKLGSYNGFTLFKMAVMEAAIFEAL